MHLRLLILVITLPTLVACSDCGSNSDAVSMAKGLTQPRLAQLYRDVATLDLEESGDVHLLKDGKAGIPAKFKDLEPQSIISDGQTARVNLAGCSDDKVFLMVHGLNGKGSKKITLVPGEAKESVVLWQVK